VKLVARKRFGQHFLTDRGVIQAMVRAIDPVEQDRLVEIGPGRAALSTALLERIGSLQAVEIDRDLVTWLRARFAGSRLTVFEHDALAFDYSALAASGPIRVVGNLPYNISSPLLVHLLSHRHAILDQHFMLQKEVVDRIVASPGSSEFGRLSVLLQAFYDVESLFDVAPESFDPPPRVMSAVIRMLPRAETSPGVPLQALETVLAQGFSQRRKMLRKTLLVWLEQQGVDPTGIDPTARAEDLPVACWVDLAQRWQQTRSRG
jgi:16S rRNA (adenine1518-N6/adenine1519-N6)-dimethyltransferase